jgi:catechol 2,3-dioxygenase-like lactoylglutathione lyase family enzyme
MKVKGIVWLGTRTDQFEPMLTFCQNLLGLTPVFVEPGFAALDMPNGDRFEIFGAASSYNTFLTYPVCSFLVDDIVAARAEMEAYGIEFIEPTHTEEDGNAWCYFRAPDGFLYSLTYIPEPAAN